MKKENCWEYYNCGREPAGKNVEKNGLCAVFEQKNLNGINGGRFGGRICWSVSGTLCQSIVGGVLAKNITSCMLCDFYKKVKKEEAQQEFKIISPKISRDQ